MHVYPAQQADLLVKRALYGAGDSITGGDADLPVNADGQVDHQVRPEAMRVNLLHLPHTLYRPHRACDPLTQRPAGNGVHQVRRRPAQDFQAGAEHKQGHDRAGQRVHP